MTTTPARRGLGERLAATFGRPDEALSPRALRKLLAQLQAVVDPRLSEVEAGRLAAEIAGWYAGAPPAERRDAWLLMSEPFGPDLAELQAAREQYEKAVGTPEAGAAEVRLRRAAVSPRTRLLQRFSAYEGGMHFLVDLRAELLPHLKSDKRLLPLEAELEHLFSTWFDVAFLELRRISWDSPASLIEKLIKYEAVHDIRSWSDVKNRLDSDRRCYGFFHARLPGEPLIFVEVALLDQIASSITPLLDESEAAADLEKASVAIFYSISNTQPGLRGVSFGDSLIKHVVETLKAEFPRLKVYATLSPIPGFRAWLVRHAQQRIEALPQRERSELLRSLGEPQAPVEALVASADEPDSLEEKSPVRRFVLRSAAHYLARELAEGRPLDAVARFHLGNGARVEALNWAADPSPKGIKQSCGLMVNYLYDLKRLDRYRLQLARGEVATSPGIDKLLA